MIPHTQVPGVHLSDYIACMKVATGEWFCDQKIGEIYSTKTGEPLKFRKKSNGYYQLTVRHKGMSIAINKHRAVYVIANIQFGIPTDLSLEVDHINNDKQDCRIENLRLVTKYENEWAKPNAVKPEVIRKIRETYDKGGVTQKSLCDTYHLSSATVSRIVRRKTYVGIEDLV